MPATISTTALASLWNPLTNWPWGSLAPTRAELIALLATVEPVSEPVHSDSPTEVHVGRIRHFVEMGIPDAIEIDVGCPVLGYYGPEWPVIDGNHRLAAAILRRDPTIDVYVGGQLDHAATLLGVSEDSLIERREGL